MPERVFLIANPASGQRNLDIRRLNEIFRETGTDWDVSYTKKAGDARALARQAADSANADLIVAFGGDGTVAEVASGLVNRDVPMAIIPGGTANVLSVELGIPTDFEQACALLCTDSPKTRRIDMGEVGDEHFLLRLSVGFEAEMVAGADRNLKDQLGTLAYALSALEALRDPVMAKYHFLLDGVELEQEGVACIVANSGNLGFSNLQLAPTIRIDDGLLDVILVQTANLSAAFDLGARILGRDEVESPEHAQYTDNKDSVRHWQAKVIEIQTDPAQRVQRDGELHDAMPVSIRIIPSAVEVVVPDQVHE